MRNKDVKTLQLFLIDQNIGLHAKTFSLNSATNYFGKLTRSALSEWQKAKKYVLLVDILVKNKNKN